VTEGGKPPGEPPSSDDAPADNSRRAFLRGGFLRGGLLGALREPVDRARRARGDAEPTETTREKPEKAARKPAPGPQVTATRRRAPAQLRPPGAVAEADFLARCDRTCDACIKACPVDAIAPAPRQLRDAAGTPVLRPADKPCNGCPDREVPACIEACPTGALHPDGDRRIGTVRILKSECLAHRNVMCSTCVERCPVQDAIGLRIAWPVVNIDVCTGCGTCASVCPAPGRAMVVTPIKNRPTPAAPDAP